MADNTENFAHMGIFWTEHLIRGAGPAAMRWLTAALPMLADLVDASFDHLVGEC